jgi:putative transcriptional regulator
VAEIEGTTGGHHNVKYRAMELNNIAPGQGKLLLSEPFQKDLYFKRTVVLLTEHNEMGTVGFILNKPLDIRIHEALDDFPEYDCPLYFGGPVSKNQLFYIHTLGDKLEGSMEIGNGLYWGGSFDTLRLLVEQNQVSPKDLRFFAGYSGWEPQQLEKELEEKSWIVANSRLEYVMNGNSQKLWGTVLKGMGQTYAVMANFPEDPSLN